MLDDLFERSKHGKHDHHSTSEHRRRGYRDDRYGHDNPLLELAQRILRNKAILVAIIAVILILGALGIWLIVALMPYLGQFITAGAKTLEQQGIKGILEAIMPLLQKIWEGAGK
jgi:hypothetical protein